MPVDAPDGQKSETDPQNHSSQDIGRKMDVEVKAGKGDQNGKNESGNPPFFIVPQDDDGSGKGGIGVP